MIRIVSVINHSIQFVLNNNNAKITIYFHFIVDQATQIAIQIWQKPPKSKCFELKKGLAFILNILKTLDFDST